ncbi:MAG: hypothetical protein ACRDQV_04710 [Pseudonocardiaceae bacterium]
MDGERDVGPIAEGDLVAGRWTGVGVTPDGEHMHFFGNDILRARDGRFVEHWVASSASRGIEEQRHRHGNRVEHAHCHCGRSITEWAERLTTIRQTLRSQQWR